MELDPQCPANSKTSNDGNPAENASASKEEVTLPKLSPQEFRQWNHMADHMNLYVSLNQ
jgi:hypothetical protein